MDIATLCKRQVVIVDSEAALRDAAVLMRDHHVGALVVTDSAEVPRVLGVVTDRDLALGALAGELDAAAVPVGQLASDALVAIAGTASLQEAVDAMEQNGVRRLLVTDDDDGVIGFISADDVVEAIAVELAGLASALRSGIARESAEQASAEPARPRPVFLPQGMPGMR